MLRTLHNLFIVTSGLFKCKIQPQIKVERRIVIIHYSQLCSKALNAAMLFKCVSDITFVSVV